MKTYTHLMALACAAALPFSAMAATGGGGGGGGAAGGSTGGSTSSGGSMSSGNASGSVQGSTGGTQQNISSQQVPLQNSPGNIAPIQGGVNGNQAGGSAGTVNQTGVTSGAMGNSVIGTNPEAPTPMPSPSPMATP